MRRPPFKVLRQYLAPQHLLTHLAGFASECKNRWWKNWAIRRFVRLYEVDLTAAESENIEDYPNFNAFFTRKIKAHLRPIVQGKKQIACPVDGTISQMGDIHEGQLLQVKGQYFNLNDLFAGHAIDATLFHNGHFITLYLAPADYHRVHMPLTGTLRSAVHVPGQLFSVNALTTAYVPRLFSRNERLVCLFETEAGPVAIILVAAMLVGSIEAVWEMPWREGLKVTLQRGEECGLFKMGSTVILLFAKDRVTWADTLYENKKMKMGEWLGDVN